MVNKSILILTAKVTKVFKRSRHFEYEAMRSVSRSCLITKARVSVPMNRILRHRKINDFQSLMSRHCNYCEAIRALKTQGYECNLCLCVHC